MLSLLAHTLISYHGDEKRASQCLSTLSGAKPEMREITTCFLPHLQSQKQQE